MHVPQRLNLCTHFVLHVAYMYTYYISRPINLHGALGFMWMSELVCALAAFCGLQQFPNWLGIGCGVKATAAS